MKRLITILLSLTCVCLVFANGQRIRQNIDFDWKFILGDNPDYSSISLYDGLWSKIQLPHDWSIGLPFDQKIGGQAAHLPGGIGWYRRTISVPSSWNNKSIHILFDGIFHQSDLYVNGHHLGFRPYGFGYIDYNITDWLQPGDDNIIAVRVDHTDPAESGARWYTGSGIYRHAWLIVTDKVHVDTYGTYVTSSVNGNAAEVSIQTRIQNDGENETELTLEHKIYDQDGSYIAQIKKEKIRIPSDKFAEEQQSVSIKNPILWSISNPYLYKIETTIKKGNKHIDTYTTTFGVRSIEFDSEKGFLLNGEQVKLKGLCLHQDDGCLGTAVPDKAYERRLRVLKDYGCNAIRMSHNQPSPELLDLCDRMGFVVIDEAFDKWKSGYYDKYFDQWWEHDLSNMLIRDRNHPSIILWSIGNELQEAWLQTNEGIERAEMLRDFVHRTEPTRPVNIAAQNNHNGRFSAVADVAGYNYLEERMISDHQKYPRQKFLVTEELPYYRGAEGNIRSYDENNPWNAVAENDFVAGGFIWAGVDYLGESAGWPSHGWPNGLFDITLHEKPRAVYHRAMWNEKPVIGIGVMDPSLDIDHGRDLWQWPNMADHWSFPQSYYGLVMEVRTTTNCDEVELWLNSHRMGRKRTSDYSNNTIKWNIPFTPGRLVAKAFRSGDVVDSCVLVSAYKAVDVKIEPEQLVLSADGQDIGYINLTLIDEKGNPVQVDNHRISVSISGEGQLIGINSGDLRRKEPFNSTSLNTYFGRAQIVVRSTRVKGIITAKIHVEGINKEYVCRLITTSPLTKGGTDR